MAGNVNCMHSKLQLLFHPTHLRIVVPSANLVPYDWGEGGGIMENIVFLIDLPRLEVERPENEARDNLTYFGKELIYFVEAMGLEQDVVKGVLNFDFTATEGIAFVHTIGGSHPGETWRRTGYCGLGATVQTLGLQHRGPIEIDFVASSIGSLNDAFLRTIYLATQGDDGMTEFTWRTTRPSSQRRLGATHGHSQQPREEEISEMVRTKFRVYFPTKDTVIASKGGTMAGGTICLQPRWYYSPTFPRSLFRDCQSQRTGMLMHNKIMFARPQSPDGVQDSRPWVYVGSANLSESAWGRLVQDKKTKQPRLNCRNWECGVVVPMPVLKAGEDEQGSSRTTSMDVFTGHVPIPMQVPGTFYGSKTPWFNTQPEA